MRKNEREIACSRVCIWQITYPLNDYNVISWFPYKLLFLGCSFRSFHLFRPFRFRSVIQSKLKPLNNHVYRWKVMMIHWKHCDVSGPLRCKQHWTDLLDRYLLYYKMTTLTRHCGDTVIVLFLFLPVVLTGVLVVLLPSNFADSSSSIRFCSLSRASIASRKRVFSPITLWRRRT